MGNERYEYFKELLLNQLKMLLHHGDSTVSDMRKQENQSADPADRASMDEQQFMQLRIRDRESRLIKKIMEAIERIGNGTFGSCEICGEDIGFKRLCARPVTTLCIDCKTKQEKFERAAGE